MLSTIARLTGEDETSWSQVHDFTPSDAQKLASRGRLIVIITLVPDPKEAQSQSLTQGRQILSQIHADYFDNHPKSGAYQALKRAVETAFKAFSKLGKLEIRAISLVGGTVYLVGHNSGGKMLLMRQGVLGQILAFSEGKLVSASGHPQPGDTLFFGSQNFFDQVSQGVLKAALGTADIESLAENFASEMAASGNKGRFVMVALRFNPKPQIQINDLPAIDPKKIQEPEITPEKVRVAAGIRVKTANFLNLLLNYLPERQLRVRSETEKQDSSQSRKTAVFVGVILIVLLGVSIFFGVKQRGEKVARARYAPRLEEAKHNFDQSKNLASLDPARARELLLSAKKLSLEIKNEGVVDEELEKLLSQINESIGEIAGIYEENPELFIDLSLLVSDFEGKDLDSSDGRLLILDKEGKRLVGITLSTKKSSVIAGPDSLENGQLTAIYVDRNFVLTDKGILEVEKEEARMVIEKDWEDGEDFYLYAGNIYLLDKKESLIWRYPGIEEGFGSRQNWFGPGVAPELGDSASWSIDGAIWILRQNGKVTKFSLGKPDSFTISGLETPITQAADIYTNEEATYLYLLDSENSRVVVVDKQGKFKAEYFSETLKGAQKLIASEKDEKVIFLKGAKLYELNLGHLD